MASARIVVIGAGVAGAATAAALARAGSGPGVILEREAIPGFHASGRNAGIACLAEFDPVVRRLAVESIRRLRELSVAGEPVLRRRSGLYLGSDDDRGRLAACADALGEMNVRARMFDAAAARAHFPWLEAFVFDWMLESADEGVLDIHALLLWYLDEARRGRFSLLTRTTVEGLQLHHGRVTGVVTSRGIIAADIVVDATGAWAGRLGRDRPLGLQPVRRHLFTTGETDVLPEGGPLVWHVSRRYYVRPEGRGLLLSACDESVHPPGTPQVDAAAADLLASKLLDGAPRLADLPVRTSWACLRTFAPDRRPVIGADPEVAGLFHVSGLGGFGMGTSWAIGEVAAAVIDGRRVPFVNAADIAPERVMAASPSPSGA